MLWASCSEARALGRRFKESAPPFSGLDGLATRGAHNGAIHRRGGSQRRTPHSPLPPFLERCYRPQEHRDPLTLFPARPFPAMWRRAGRVDRANHSAPLPPAGRAPSFRADPSGGGGDPADNHGAGTSGPGERDSRARRQASATACRKRGPHAFPRPSHGGGLRPTDGRCAPILRACGCRPLPTRSHRDAHARGSGCRGVSGTLLRLQNESEAARRGERGQREGRRDRPREQGPAMLARLEGPQCGAALRPPPGQPAPAGRRAGRKERRPPSPAPPELEGASENPGSWGEAAHFLPAQQSNGDIHGRGAGGAGGGGGPLRTLSGLVPASGDGPEPPLPHPPRARAGGVPRGT